MVNNKTVPANETGKPRHLFRVPGSTGEDYWGTAARKTWFAKAAPKPNSGDQRRYPSDVMVNRNMLIGGHRIGMVPRVSEDRCRGEKYHTIAERHSGPHG
jgi:hypothetical protein